MTEILFSVVYLQLYILMKPDYLFILGVRLNIPVQLIMISRRRCKHDANISLTRTVVRRYALIGDFTTSWVSATPQG